jgi:hypothetical protein
MYTIDRINRLRSYYGLPPISTSQLFRTGYINLSGKFVVNAPHPAHVILDALDNRAGIFTGIGAINRIYEYVGARLARHEEHMALGRRGAAALDIEDDGFITAYAPPFFWLGAEALQLPHEYEYTRTP